MSHRSAIRPLATSLLGIVLLGGCSWMGDYKGTDANAMGPPPQVKIMQTADATWIKPNETAPVEHSVPVPGNADKDAMTRLSNLEHQVQAMQTDMTSLMPMLTQMVAVQTNIQTMLAHLQANGTLPPGPVPPNGPADVPPVMQPSTPLPPPSTPPIAANDTNANGSMNAIAATGDNAKTVAPIAPLVVPPLTADKPPTPVTPDKMAAASATPPTMSPPATTATTAPTASPMIQDVRVGEHPGTTRIVVDVSDKVAFSNDLDNDEHILTINVKGAGWKGPSAERKIDHSPLLVSWQTQSDTQGGTRIIMQLSKKAKIANSEFLPVGHDQPARIVLDLAAN